MKKFLYSMLLCVGMAHGGADDHMQDALLLFKSHYHMLLASGAEQEQVTGRLRAVYDEMVQAPRLERAQLHKKMHAQIGKSTLQEAEWGVYVAQLEETIERELGVACAYQQFSELLDHQQTIIANSPFKDVADMTALLEQYVNACQPIKDALAQADLQDDLAAVSQYERELVELWHAYLARRKELGA